MPNRPLVSAVMVTGHKPARKPLALIAIESLLAQTYQELELVVVTTGFRLELPQALKGRVHQIPYSPAATLGELRNAAQSACSGDYITQWDDDDWSHPERIEEQLSAAEANPRHAVLLKSQVRYSFASNAATVRRWHNQGGIPGIPGTILYPAKQPLPKYHNIRRDEDTRFVRDHFHGRVVVLDNFPHLYLRFWHGANTWDEKFVMDNFKAGEFRIPEDSAAYLRSVLPKYSLFTNRSGA